MAIVDQSILDTLQASSDLIGKRVDNLEGYVFGALSPHITKNAIQYGAGRVVMNANGLFGRDNSSTLGVSSFLLASMAFNANRWSNNQSESLAAGSVMLGSNAATYANMLWDPAAKQLKFRGGTTTQAYIDTNGKIAAGGGNVWMDSNGLFGKDASNVAAFGLLAVAGNANLWGDNVSESLASGSVMLGSNKSTFANMLWDPTAKQLKFRGGTTTQAYIDTNGKIAAGGGNVWMDSNGLFGKDASNVAAFGLLAVAGNANLWGDNVSESLASGSVMLGSNKSTFANMLWDPTAKQLKFRGGTTTQAYIDTDGTITFGGGSGKLNSNGLSLNVGSFTYNMIRWLSGTNSVLEINSSSAGVSYFLSKNNAAGTAYHHIYAQDAGDSTYADLTIWAGAGTTQGVVVSTGGAATAPSVAGVLFEVQGAPPRTKLFHTTPGALHLQTDIVSSGGAYRANFYESTSGGGQLGSAISINLSTQLVTFPKNVEISNGAPNLLFTDTTVLAKSLQIYVDANLADLRESAGAQGSLLVLDLANNRVGVGKNPTQALDVTGQVWASVAVQTPQMLVGHADRGGGGSSATDIGPVSSGSSVLSVFTPDAVTTPPKMQIMGRTKYTGNSYTTGPYIELGKENATDGNFAYYVAFGVRPNGGSSQEAFRLNSDNTAKFVSKIATYNNIATQGYGVPAIVSRVGSTGNTAAIADTNFANAGAAGEYLVSYYIVVTTADGASTATLQVQIKWNDGTAARTFNSASISTTATNYKQDMQPYIRLGSGNVTYGVTVTGSIGTAQYALYAVCMRLN